MESSSILVALAALAFGAASAVTVDDCVEVCKIYFFTFFIKTLGALQNYCKKTFPDSESSQLQPGFKDEAGWGISGSSGLIFSCFRFNLQIPFCHFALVV
jgi:hypothetical protein